MASCEKCWNEAGGDPKIYRELLKTNNCTPEEQAGVGAEKCPKCDRNTVHIYCHSCVICGEHI